MLTQDSLAHFTGSESFARYLGGYVLSEGALHVAQEGGAFWLIDVIFSHQTDPKVAKEEFQVWTLQVMDGGAVVTCDDGNGNVITKQEIEYTDFPLPKITLWLQNKTIFLPSEY